MPRTNQPVKAPCARSGKQHSGVVLGLEQQHRAGGLQAGTDLSWAPQGMEKLLGSSGVTVLAVEEDVGTQHPDVGQLQHLQYGQPQLDTTVGGEARSGPEHCRWWAAAAWNVFPG